MVQPDSAAHGNTGVHAAQYVAHGCEQLLGFKVPPMG